jgi:ArsR family transcriptional regulator
MVKFGGIKMSELVFTKIDTETYSKISKIRLIIRAVKHPVNIRIIELLLEGKKRSVGEIASHINISQPIVSQHLSLLRKTKIVGVAKVGRMVFYHINQSVYSAFCKLLQDLHES